MGPLSTPQRSPALTRAWAMPNRHPFVVAPVCELIARYHAGTWCDPFAGRHSPAALRNDLDPAANADSHEDALAWLKDLPDDGCDGAFYDPPYSPRQAAECYKRIGAGSYVNEGYWANVKDHLARIVRAGGVVICCGWNSNGMGSGRGFELIELLVVAHGAQHNDTLVTVERKGVGGTPQEGPNES